jgi:hypothetical protein
MDATIMERVSQLIAGWGQFTYSSKGDAQELFTAVVRELLKEEDAMITGGEAEGQDLSLCIDDIYTVNLMWVGSGRFPDVVDPNTWEVSVGYGG